MPFFYGGAQFANLDMLVAACIACTILCAADAVLAAEGGRPRRSTLAGAYAFAALGILAKGLIGIVIPGLVIGAWLIATGRAAMILRLVWLPGLALFAAIAVPWFALMEARHPGFLNYFFVHHHLQRYATRRLQQPAPVLVLPAGVRRPDDALGRRAHSYACAGRPPASSATCMR